MWDRGAKDILWNHYDNSLFGALKDLYPNKPWDVSQFPEEINRRKRYEVSFHS